MNIIFMGTPDYATAIFREILGDNRFKISLLVTQKDKPVGRKQILTPPHIKKWVIENGVDIDIFQPDSLKSENSYEKIASYKPDIIVVAAYGKILPKNILDIAPCINLHASLLPLYRGASPIQSTILNQDKFSGVTAMMMEEELDSGDILAFRYIKAQDKRVDALFEEISSAAAKLTLSVLENFKNLNPISQLSFDATYCVKIKKSNGLIKKNETAQEIYRKYLAYTPWPGVFLENGLKLKELKLLESDSKNSDFFVIKEIKKESLVISCKEGSLELLKLQAPSKKEVSAVEFIRGARIGIGDKLV